jgi:PD-(D/E)XK nuclease family transposase
MPKFNKSENELETDFDRWMYVFKNLQSLDNMPAKLQNKIFSKLFGEAELANLQPKDRAAYEESLKVYRDLKNVTDTAFEDGFKEGIDAMKVTIENERKLKEEERKLKEEERRQKVILILALINSGKSVEEISMLLDIDAAEIFALVDKEKK